MSDRQNGWTYLPRKMAVQTTAAVCLIVLSSWMPKDLQETARNAGWGGVVAAWSFWLANQGRRKPGNGEGP